MYNYVRLSSTGVHALCLLCMLPTGYLRITNSSVLRVTYMTRTSRISLLLHETEGEVQGQVLITMISYECL